MRIRGATCRVQRCKHPPAIDGMCKSHALDQADYLFGIQVRSVGRCEIDEGPHKGNLQCAHGFSRVYWPVRWTLDNAVCLCAGHHFYYTKKAPLEWDDWFLEHVGFETYWDLRSRALTRIKPDLEMILMELKVAV